MATKTPRSTNKALGSVIQDLSPSEAPLFLTPIPDGVSRVFWIFVSAQKADELLAEGWCVQAANIFLGIGMKKRALKAINKGFALNRANPKVLETLMELKLAAKELPG